MWLLLGQKQTIEIFMIFFREFEGWLNLPTRVLCLLPNASTQCEWVRTSFDCSMQINGSIEKWAQYAPSHTDDSHLKFEWSLIISCRFYTAFCLEQIVAASFILFLLLFFFVLRLNFFNTLNFFGHYLLDGNNMNFGSYLRIEIFWTMNLMIELESFQKWPL